MDDYVKPTWPFKTKQLCSLSCCFPHQLPRAAFFTRSAGPVQLLPLPRRGSRGSPGRGAVNAALRPPRQGLGCQDRDQDPKLLQVPGCAFLRRASRARGAGALQWWAQSPAVPSSPSPGHSPSSPTLSTQFSPRPAREKTPPRASPSNAPAGT